MKRGGITWDMQNVFTETLINAVNTQELLCNNNLVSCSVCTTGEMAKRLKKSVCSHCAQGEHTASRDNTSAFRCCSVVIVQDAGSSCWNFSWFSLVFWSQRWHNCVVLCIEFWIALFHALFVSIVLRYVLFVCKCVLYYCRRVSIQLQLTNISYHIKWQ